MGEYITLTEQIFKINIMRLRKKHNYSKYKAAHMIGIAYSHYHKLENMEVKSTPSFEVLEKIAEIYGVKVSNLFECYERDVDEQK